LADGLRAAAEKAGVAAQVNTIGSLATMFFAPQPVRNYNDAKKSDTKRYGEFFRNMLDRGIFLAPSQYEAAFVSTAHTDADIERTLLTASESLKN
jgi:glutamate-1-semialdehyde 2,1-aminomutase